MNSGVDVPVRRHRGSQITDVDRQLSMRTSGGDRARGAESQGSLGGGGIRIATLHSVIPARRREPPRYKRSGEDSRRLGLLLRLENTRRGSAESVGAAKTAANGNCRLMQADMTRHSVPGLSRANELTNA
eukprot:GHVU01209243.1.p2 GENE.GHVU01209243.1~~GHVU01209243.1.p2  ORF type:complete len:130 (-),score=3.94 GHVU01209243.1:473-862(-)